MSADGRVDVLVGAPGSTADDPGHAYVEFMGPPRAGVMTLATSDVILTGENGNDRFGTAIGAGMIVRQELATPSLPPRDMIVSAPGWGGGRGAVYLFAGPFASADQRLAVNATLIVRGAPGDQLGSAIVAADIDGDNYRDIIMAAPGTGRIYVIYGGPGLAGVWDLSLRTADVTMTLPAGPVTLTGEDFNGDGRKELVIGYPTGTSGAGVVYVVMGRSRASFGSVAAVSALAPPIIGNAGDGLGTALEILDINGDGIMDLAMSAPNAAGPNGRANAGAAYVFTGSRTFASPTSVGAATMTVFGAAPGHHLGAALGHGSVRRDLQDDLLILAPGASASGNIYVANGAPRALLPPMVDLATAPARVLRGDPTHPPVRSIVSAEVTGEGAQDIIAGVPTQSAGANASAGVLYVAYSPILSSSPRVTTLSVAQGASVTRTVNITNGGTLNVAWSARSNTPWLAMSGASGTSSADSSGSVTLTISPGGLAPGTYTGGLTYVSTDRNLVWADTAEIDLTVTPGAGGTTGPLNPFGVPDPPDEGAPGGVLTPAGTNVTVIPVKDVLVRFTNVTTSGHTRVDITRSSQANGPGIIWGPWFYRISTDAVYSGPVVIGVAYDAALVTPSTGFVRISTGSAALPTDTVNTTQRYVLATAPTLPVTVTVQNDFHTDFSDDGFVDLLWQRQSDSAMTLWATQNASQVAGAQPVTFPSIGDSHWKVVGSADFDKDGFPDLLWRHDTLGTFGVWLMQGNTIKSRVMLNPTGFADTAWKVVAVADFDGDGYPDLLWRHDTLGTFGVWLMTGTNLRARVMLNPTGIADTSWKVVGVGDFNGDGHPDLLWRNDVTGAAGIWLMNGTNFRSATMLTPTVADMTWRIEGVADVDGDGKQDIIWHNTVTGAVAAWCMDGVNGKSSQVVGPGTISGNWRLVGAR